MELNQGWLNCGCYQYQLLDLFQESQQIPVISHCCLVCTNDKYLNVDRQYKNMKI